MRSLIEDPALASKMGQAGYARVQDKFAYPTFQQQLEGFVQDAKSVYQGQGDKAAVSSVDKRRASMFSMLCGGVVAGIVAIIIRFVW
jgi:hypothetical protein